MLYELENQPEIADRAKAAPVVGALPASLVYTQRAAAMLRAYLSANGLDHYRIFACSNFDLYDIERHFSRLDDSARWEPLASSVVDGEPVTLMTHDEKGAYGWGTGCLRLSKFELVLARWYWINVEDTSSFAQLWLIATPTEAHFHTLHQQVLQHRHDRGAGIWQIVRGFSHSDGPRTRRETVAEDSLVLTPSLRDQLQRDVIHFFSDDVAKLYAGMNVAYRRGLLLHGPPGNGKTSIIRFVGAALMHIPFMLLRPFDNFDSDDLEEIIRRWTTQAPAVLVIEDLNWMLKKVDLSMFLNLLDGIDVQLTGGLMLIATTNDADALDPALNNRPGRFDVVIQIDPPEHAQRLEFLRLRLGEMEIQMLEQVSQMTDGLSFAHLQEILRLSGLLAIQRGHAAREPGDLLEAARLVIDSRDNAIRGFPRKPEIPFGFAHLRNRNR